MKNQFKDAIFKIRKDAAALLGFPWSAPAAPSARSSTSNGFVETVTDKDLLEEFLRNPAANAVVMDVAYDAVSEFNAVGADEKPLEEFDAAVQVLYEEKIEKQLKKALLFTRLYGYCGILIGYADGMKLSEEADRTKQIKYLQVIPKPWIDEVATKKDGEGNPLFPLELDNYKINIGNKPTQIDASRIVHITNRSIQEETITGTSSLLRIYDALTIIRSMIWGTGQAVWRHGGGLTVFIAPDSTDPQTQIDAIDEIVTDMNAMTVLTMPPGTEVVTGSTGALNPKEYFDVIIKQIAIGSRIPTSILTGSQAGTLTASEKDRVDYSQLLTSIQDSILTQALTDIVKRFQESKQLPEQEFLIAWNRTPIRALEEAKENLLKSETKLNEARTQTELATAKKLNLEYKDLQEQMSLWGTG
jgi:phage-related protein (TIGR01555 family)